MGVDDSATAGRLRLISFADWSFEALRKLGPQNSYRFLDPKMRGKSDSFDVNLFEKRAPDRMDVILRNWSVRAYFDMPVEPLSAESFFRAEWKEMYLARLLTLRGF